jgi:ribose transport system permease protein
MTSTTLTPVRPAHFAASESRGDRIRGLVVRFTPLLLLVLLLVVVAIINPATVGGNNLLNVLVNATPIAILGLGAMWILVSGGLDLSAGFGVAMCALVIGGGLQQGLPLPVVIINGVLAGLALGLVNGLLIGLLGMPPFIATLATMAGTQGIVLLLGKQGTVIVNDDVLSYLGGGRLLGVPLLIVIALVIALIVGFVARNTLFGLHTYGLGSNADAMRARGVPVIRDTVLVYVFGGLMVALTAVVLVAKVQIVDTNIANTNLLLDAFAATIIGGTSLFGGKGTVVGTLVGAVIISLISTSLVVVGVSAQNIDLFKGMTIVVAVMIDAGIRFLEKRRDT